MAKKILYIEENKITEYLGNYNDYLETKNKQLVKSKGKNR